MKRIGLTLMVILLLTFPLFSQYVRFQDRYFAQALIEAGVDTNGDRNISYAEAEAVTSIDLPGCGPWPCDVYITSLVGIEAFVNLKTITIHYSELTGLDVSNNTALTELDCRSNGLTSLDVSGCTDLRILNCGNNLLFFLDLSNNTALTYLNCSHMEVPLEVCVWESFPAGVTVDITDSPPVYFTTECDAPIKYFRFGSTGDPLNGLTLAWNNNGTADSIAWGYTPDLEKGEAAGVISTSILGTQFDYTFPSLTDASTIHYSIFDSYNGIWTEIKTFTTASDPSNNQYSFTALGDSRSHPDKWQIISEATLDTDFTLFLGDIVNAGYSQSDWVEWFVYGKELISRQPIYHAVGNHDEDNSPGGYENYSSLFTLPGNMLYYSFAYGNAVFVCLNSLEAGNSEQYNWLLSTLEANKDKTWKFVFTHKPFYTSPSHEGEMDGYFYTWWKAFDDYGVDMIFAGHTHNYQRTRPINRNISTTSPVGSYGSGEGQGRCQIVSGGAGVSLKDAADPSLWWLQESASKHHFCNIDIDGALLTFSAIDANQVVFDEFIIDKSSYVGTSDFRSTNSRIYPNPTNDLLTIETNGSGEHAIEIISLNGQLLISKSLEGTSHQIDLSSFQKGVYFITIWSKDHVTTRKIIKM